MSSFVMKTVSFVIVSILIVSSIDEIHGKPPSRIMSGQNATLGEFPHAVLILGLKTNGQLSTCGGAIISSRHILTAAHCLLDLKSASASSGALGYYDGKPTITPGSSFIKYPKYIPESEEPLRTTPGHDDLGIFVLSKDLDLGTLQKKIDLPTEDVNKDKETIFAGWGRLNATQETRNLQKASVILLPKDKCANEPQEFCGYIKNGDLCVGDSGTALIADGKLVGIAVRSNCEIEHIHYYTNVYHYVDWIKSIINTK